jgi:hypothetical protein
MNMQKRSDERSIALHKEIANKLRSNPGFWGIPRKNIERWEKTNGGLSAALVEWERILRQNTKEQVLSLLESDSEESIRLRSSSPFTGILSDNERKMVFEAYSSKRKLQNP